MGPVQEEKSFFFFSSRSRALFMGPTSTLLKKNFKIRSHSTIHIFKNYFATIFSIFSFQQNKRYPNKPVVLLF